MKKNGGIIFLFTILASCASNPEILLPNKDAPVWELDGGHWPLGPWGENTVVAAKGYALTATLVEMNLESGLVLGPIDRSEYESRYGNANTVRFQAGGSIGSAVTSIKGLLNARKDWIADLDASLELVKSQSFRFNLGLVTADDALYLIGNDAIGPLSLRVFSKEGIFRAEIKTSLRAANHSPVVNNGVGYILNVTVDGSLLYIYSGGISVVDLASGRELWSKELDPTAGEEKILLSGKRALMLEIEPSILRIGDALISFDARGEVFAFDRHTGAELWSKKLGNVATITEYDGKVLVTQGVVTRSTSGLWKSEGPYGLVLLAAIDGRRNGGYQSKDRLVGVLPSNGEGGRRWFIHENRIEDYDLATDNILAQYPFSLRHGKEKITGAFKKGPETYLMSSKALYLISGDLEVTERVSLDAPADLTGIASLDISGSYLLLKVSTKAFGGLGSWYFVYDSQRRVLVQSLPGDPFILMGKYLASQTWFDPSTGILVNNDIKNRRTLAYGYGTSGGEGASDMDALDGVDPAASAPVSAAAREEPTRDGFSADTAFFLPRHTIKMEEKPDSWAGIEPIIDNTFGIQPFLGSIDNAVSKVFLCRDDKYLYWRVEFVGSNPLHLRPNTLVNDLFLQVHARIEKDKLLCIGVTYRPKDNSITSWLSIWDEATRTGKSIPSSSMKIVNGNDSLIGRMTFGDGKEYLTRPLKTFVSMGTSLKDSKWTEQRTPTVFVEFGK